MIMVAYYTTFPEHAPEAILAQSNPQFHRERKRREERWGYLEVREELHLQRETVMDGKCSVQWDTLAERGKT